MRTAPFLSDIVSLTEGESLKQADLRLCVISLSDLLVDTRTSHDFLREYRSLITPESLLLLNKSDLVESDAVMEDSLKAIIGAFGCKYSRIISITTGIGLSAFVDDLSNLVRDRLAI